MIVKKNLDRCGQRSNFLTNQLPAFRIVRKNIKKTFCMAINPHNINARARICEGGEQDYEKNHRNPSLFKLSRLIM